MAQQVWCVEYSSQWCVHVNFNMSVCALWQCEALRLNNWKIMATSVTSMLQCYIVADELVFGSIGMSAETTRSNC